MTKPCIFCKMLGECSVEHIVPEGLIGEEVYKTTHSLDSSKDRETLLVLNNCEVCLNCNTQLSKLDSKLQDEFGLFKVFWNRKGTKRGRPAKIERPGLYGVHLPDGPFLHFNSESHGICLDDGTILSPSNKKSKAVEVSEFEAKDGEATLKFRMKISFNKVIFRAIYKICFELLCLQEGYNTVVDDRFNALRQYIRYGKGHRYLIYGSLENPEAFNALTLELREIPGTCDWIGKIDLGMPIFVDLTPDNIVGMGKHDELKRAGFLRVRDDHMNRQS